MEIRVYEDKRKQYCDYVDTMTIFFPVSKRLQGREQCRAYCISGKPMSNGVWRGTDSFYLPVGVPVNSNQCYLGKRVKIDTLPKPTQDEINRLSTLWNEAVTTDSEEAWERWDRA